MSHSGQGKAEGTCRISDQQLLMRVREGSQQHFELLVTRYQERVFRLVCGVLGPQHIDDAVDVAQVAWAKVYTQLDGFRGESSFATWLYRLVYRCAVDQLRKYRRSPELDALDAARSDDGPTPAEMAESDDRNEVLRQAVACLPQTYRLVLLLHYWQECSINEIAEILCASSGTIKSYLHRGRQRLAHTLERQQ